MGIVALHVNYSRCKDNQEVLQRMEHYKEPKLSLLLALVHPLDGEEGQGKTEGGDEVDRLLLDRALAELGRTKDTITSHQSEMYEEKEVKKSDIPPYV